MSKQIMRGVASAAILLTSVAFGQTAAVDYLSQSDFLAKAKVLEKTASVNGVATETLDKYPGHFTMLTVRTQSGGAEVHQNFADFFVIVRGNVTLITGGTVVAPKTVKPGEVQGSEIKDGAAEQLRDGDVVHISAGVPHQLLLPPNSELVYFVIKVAQP